MSLIENSISKKKLLLFFIVIALVLFISYNPALYSGFIWDDNDYVTENSTLKSPSGIFDIWKGNIPQYYPLVHTSFWIEYQLFKLSPFVFHFNNILLHFFNVLLLFLFFRKIKLHGKFLAIIIFALSPVHVESVAWITERKNLLSLLFFLLSLNCYWSFITDKKDVKKFYWLALLFYVLALFSKTIACSLPVTIILLSVWKNIKITKKYILQIIPLFFIGFAFALLTIWFELNKVGAKGVEFNWSALQRMLIASRAWFFYIYKNIFPVNLCFTYPKWDVLTDNPYEYLFLFLFVITFLTLIVLYRKGNRGLLIAILIYSANIFPSLGFFNIYPMKYYFVADHFQYFASIPIISIIAYCLIKITDKNFFTQLFLFCSIIMLLGILSFQQSKIYKNKETLWRDSLKKSPDSILANKNLGCLLAKRKSMEALIYLNKSIILNSKDPSNYTNLASFHFDMNDVDQALMYALKAVKINPFFVKGNELSANLLYNTGKTDEAMEFFHKAIELGSNNGMLFNNLAHIYELKKQKDLAVMYYLKAIEYNPELVEPLFNVGTIFIEQQNYSKAVKFLNDAYKLNKNNKDVVINLRYAYSKLKQQNNNN